jgi:hypothetical protein
MRSTLGGNRRRPRRRARARGSGGRARRPAPVTSPQAAQRAPPQRRRETRYSCSPSTRRARRRAE